jgi:hypothetical protein
MGFVTVSQRDIRPPSLLLHRSTAEAPAELPDAAPPANKTTHAEAVLPDPAPLLKKALDMLPEKEEQ